MGRHNPVCDGTYIHLPQVILRKIDVSLDKGKGIQ